MEEGEVEEQGGEERETEGGCKRKGPAISCLCGNGNMLAREVKILRGKQPSTSSIDSYSSSPPSIYPSSCCSPPCSSPLPTLPPPSFKLKRTSCIKMLPSQFEPSEPSQVDVRESSTQAPGAWQQDTMKHRDIFVVCEHFDCEPFRRCSREKRRPNLFTSTSFIPPQSQ